MSAASARSTPRKSTQSASEGIVLSDKEFSSMSKLIRDRFGIDLKDEKRDLIPRRLNKRLKQLGLSSYAAYIQYLERHWDGEYQTLANAITTNLTSFFRERHHFDFISEQFIPDILERKSLQRRIRIWSAACSTGEEPYSIAMTLHQHANSIGHFDIKILATDIDTNVLTTAASGEYTGNQLSGIDPEILESSFDAIGNKRYQVRSHLSDYVHFRRLNFFDNWPMRGNFDLIVCRNALIYFNEQTQRQLLEKFARHQQPGDYLIVGHSESLERLTTQYELIGKTTYKRI
ncbi:protein-glutamate O-methyltransferase CheR [bacterium]|nr:protein-glutamate O-methyltransferase CheR [bacterium]